MKSTTKKVISTSLIPAKIIEHSILLIHGQKVLLDETLAELYQTETRILVKAVKRNIKRFPKDFMFQLTKEEWHTLRCHFGTPKSECLKSRNGISKSKRGGRRYAPYAFTEQGIAMLSSVLRSERAVQVNIEIMRTFVHLRQILASHEQLARKLQTLEKKCDKRFKIIFDVIRQMMTPTESKRRPIGFEDRNRRR